MICQHWTLLFRSTGRDNTPQPKLAPCPQDVAKEKPRNFFEHPPKWPQSCPALPKQPTTLGGVKDGIELEEYRRAEQ